MFLSIEAPAVFGTGVWHFMNQAVTVIMTVTAASLNGFSGAVTGVGECERR